MKTKLQIALTIALFACFASAAKAQVASNTPYVLEQSVIAGGGGTSADAGNTFSITGSIGQSVVATSSASPFTVKSGFFTDAASLPPTAATVTVGGRVSTAGGRGIRNVSITMTDSSGTMRAAISTSSGYFTFTDVPAGDTYILSAKAKRFHFNQPTQVISVFEDITALSFVAASAPRVF